MKNPKLLLALIVLLFGFFRDFLVLFI